MNSQARRNVSLLGISYCMEVEPRSMTGSYFSCPRCHKLIFDGGVPKVADCPCGGVFLRGEDGAISERPRAPISSFEDMFRVRTSAPPNQTMPTLVSVTFGFFGDGSMEPDMALRTALLPFILHRDRCFGINDLVEVLGLQFKVLAAEPLYGLAKRSTKIQCHTLLGTQPLTKIIVGAVYPKALTTEECSQKIVPYLCTPLRHVHERNYHFRPIRLRARPILRNPRSYPQERICDCPNASDGRAQATGRLAPSSVHTQREQSPAGVPPAPSAAVGESPARRVPAAALPGLAQAAGPWGSRQYRPYRVFSGAAARSEFRVPGDANAGASASAVRRSPRAGVHPAQQPNGQHRADRRPCATAGAGAIH